MPRPLLALLILFLAPAAQAGVCLDHPYDASGQPLAADIAAAYTALGPFPGMIASLDQARPRICTADGPQEALGTYDAEDNQITVSATLSPDKRVAVLLHEIRHLDQNLRGICPAPTLTMRANARAMFALEADAMAIAHLVAWSSRETGTPGIFEALRTAPETEDIAAAFEAAMTETRDPALATAAAFDAWYASDVRRERYYISTCMAYLDRMESEASLGGSTPLPADFLSHICYLPGQARYPCAEPDNVIPR